MNHRTNARDGGSDVSLNGPSSRESSTIRVLGLPISLTRAKIMSVLNELLLRNNVVPVHGRVTVVRKKTGDDPSTRKYTKQKQG